MKKEHMVLTYSQARDLKWFCQNVAGTRLEFYEVFDAANRFNDRLARLEKTCELIEKFLEVKIEPTEPASWNGDAG